MRKETADEWITVWRAAKLLRCSKSNVYRLADSGRIASMREGGTLLVSRADVVAYEASRRLAV